MVYGLGFKVQGSGFRVQSLVSGARGIFTCSTSNRLA